MVGGLLRLQAKQFIAKFEAHIRAPAEEVPIEALWSYVDVCGIELSTDLRRVIADEYSRRQLPAAEVVVVQPSNLASMAVIDARGRLTLRGETEALDSASAPPPKPDLCALHAKADFLPLDLRKRVRASVGDHAAEIDDLYRAGKYKAARVTKWWAVATAVYICLRSPIDAVIDRLTQAFSR